MTKLKKGSFGYLQQKKKREIVITVILFVIALSIYGAGLIIKKSNQSAFTVFAILMCLPASQYLIRVILYIRARGCSVSARDKIEESIGDLYGEYDLYFTSYEKNFAISHMVYADGSLYSFTEDDKLSEKSFAAFLDEMMKKGQRKKCPVHVINDLDKYVRRLKELQERNEKNVDAKELEVDADRCADLFVLLHSITL